MCTREIALLEAVVPHITWGARLARDILARKLQPLSRDESNIYTTLHLCEIRDFVETRRCKLFAIFPRTARVSACLSSLSIWVIDSPFVL